MSTPEKRHPAKRLLIPLLIYTLLLCGLYAVYVLGARYELFMQTIDTLWPVIGFTLLLTLAILNSLLLAKGIPLWSLCALHVILTALWLVSLWFRTIGHSHENGDAHICGFPWWLPLIPLCLSTLPALLGHALLQLRKRQWQKARAAEAAEFAFEDTAAILNEADDRNDADQTVDNGGKN